MKIYICAPIKEKDISGRVCTALEKANHSVYWPPRDTPQDKDELKFERNSKAIREADVFVAVLNVPGKDFAWELGYAYGLNKRIVGYILSNEYKDSPMMRDSIKELVFNIDDLLRTL